MDRKKYSIFVILYTIFNIGLLMGASDYIQQVYKNEYSDEKQVNSIDVNDNLNSEVSNEENQNKNENLAQNNAENQISTSDKEKNKMQDTYVSDDEILNYNQSYNSSSYATRNSSTQSNKVFKVTAEEIIGDLNPIEKAKILWVCRKLTKEEYNEIEEYLSYRNEKLGVMKVYAILEKKLDDESLEEVKEIFSKYIDTDKVKEIYY